MKRTIFLIFSLLFLVSCAQDVPPTPPAPGSGAPLAGRAAGLPLLASTIPSWATAVKYTNIDKDFYKYGETAKITTEKPSDFKDTFYVYGQMYIFNKKFNIWEKVPANAGQSGKIIRDWVETKGVFLVPIMSERFAKGANFAVVYACKDSGNRDDNNRIVWDCNNGKWMLMAFNVGDRYPEILIEKNIGTNAYGTSSRTTTTDGDVYEAEYTDASGVKTVASVLKLSSVSSYKTGLVSQLSSLEPKWGTRESVCGFLTVGSSKIDFSWLSGNNWVTITTHSTAIDNAKIKEYGKKYASDCNLLNTLKGVQRTTPGVCGNDILEGGEQCDMTKDAACPGACKPDCNCALTGTTGFGKCGDGIIQSPEQCDPPAVYDNFGQLVGAPSPCFIRSGSQLAVGTCNNQCMCVPPPSVAPVPFPPLCGNGVPDAGEQCDPPGLTCGANQACINCNCVNTTSCGDGTPDPGEQCGEPGLTCPAGMSCGPNCACFQTPLNWTPVGFPWPAPQPQAPAPAPVCGDNQTQAPEVCDPAGSACTDTNGNPGTCSADCLACVPIPAGCGNNQVDAGEQCDPPGSASCPGIGPGGGCAMVLCDTSCQCPDPGACAGFTGDCPGDLCDPVTNENMNANTPFEGESAGPFYVFGEHYADYDTADKQCGDICVADVKTQGGIDTDGDDVTTPGVCYGYNSLDFSVTIPNTYGTAPTTITTKKGFYGVKSACPESLTGDPSIIFKIQEPVVSGGKCELQLKDCPSGTICSETLDGAICAPPTEEYVWAAAGSCSSMMYNCPVIQCPDNLIVGESCTLYGQKCVGPSTTITTGQTCTFGVCTGGFTQTTAPVFECAVKDSTNGVTTAVFAVATTSSRSIQVLVAVLASLAILFIVGLNLVHKD